MKITKLTTFIMHVPVTKNIIGDSTHSITHWGMPGVMIETDTGLVGYGYTGTHADITTDRLITTIIQDVFGPMLIGEDASEVRYLHRKMSRSSTNIWVGRGGLMQMALSAIDIALWDLKAKMVEQPLWKVFGGSKNTRVLAYNTDCGWLVRDTAELVDDCKKMIFEEGFNAIKMKIGKPDPREDLKRIEAVRKAIGDDVNLMVDANAKWDISTAKQYGSRLAVLMSPGLKSRCGTMTSRATVRWLNISTHRLRWVSFSINLIHLKNLCWRVPWITCSRMQRVVGG